MKHAFLNIKSQKLISTLILSSIIIGMASIFGLFSIKNILSFQLQQQLSQLGENNFVATFIPDSGSISLHPILQHEKIINYIKSQKEGQVLPYSVIGSEFIYNAKKYPGMLLAVGSKISDLNIKLISGRGFSAQDNHHKVLIMGKGLAQAINPNFNELIGEYVQYHDELLKIIGLYEQEGVNLLDEHLDSSALITYPLAFRLTENIQLDHLYVASDTKQNKIETIKNLTNYYQDNISQGFFHIKDPDFILGKIKAQFSQIELVLKWVCFVTLGVGSLLLIQLFLLSLDKRKFEIGIRLACGAAPKDILLQFIQESFLYYLIGGTIGVAIGFLMIMIGLLILKIAWPFMALLHALIPVMVAMVILALLIGLIPGLRSLKLHPMSFFKPGL
jgi:ABC-type antimicrobial peptide transport system permease subunit